MNDLPKSKKKIMSNVNVSCNRKRTIFTPILHACYFRHDLLKRLFLHSMNVYFKNRTIISDPAVDHNCILEVKLLKNDRK